MIFSIIVIYKILTSNIVQIVELNIEKDDK